MRRILSFRDFDWTLLAMVLLLCTVSVFEIYSATLHTKYSGFHTKQMLWIAGGLVAMFLFAKIDYHKLIDFVPWAYGVCLLALLAVLAIGQKVLGARRWIRVGPMHFQPSEWVKLVLISPWPATSPTSADAPSPGKTSSKPSPWSAFPCCWFSSSPIWELRSPTRPF
jgi:rod shape determining protein RodA